LDLGDLDVTFGDDELDAYVARTRKTAETMRPKSEGQLAVFLVLDAYAYFRYIDHDGDLPPTTARVTTLVDRLVSPPFRQALREWYASACELNPSAEKFREFLAQRIDEDLPLHPREQRRLAGAVAVLSSCPFTCYAANIPSAAS